MKPPPFEYQRPESRDEALTALAEAGDEGKVLAGGQSLVPLLAFRMARPGVLIDIGGLACLDHAAVDNGTLTLGALATHRQVERLEALHRRCPAIVEAVGQIGHVAIRNRGTVGGSIAHADPAAEWPVLALALDATFDTESTSGERTIAAEKMFVGYMETALHPDELLTSLRFELPPPGAALGFAEVSRRHGDFAMGGAAATLTTDNGRVTAARVAVMSAGLTPLRCPAAEDILVGSEPTDDVLGEAAAAVEGAVEPLADVHAPADYKRHLAKVTTFRALRAARDRIREDA